MAVSVCCSRVQKPLIPLYVQELCEPEKEWHVLNSYAAISLIAHTLPCSLHHATHVSLPLLAIASLCAKSFCVAPAPHKTMWYALIEG